MGVAKMKYLNVYGPETVLMNTLFAIARAGTFAPESGEAIHSAIHIGTNRIEPVLTKAKGLLKDLGYSSLAQEYTGPTGVYKLDEVAAYIEKYAVEVARRNQRKIAIESELEVQVKTEGLLSHMTDLDISMDELFQVLGDVLEDGDLLLMMGAGSIGQAAQRLADDGFPEAGE